MAVLLREGLTMAGTEASRAAMHAFLRPGTVASTSKSGTAESLTSGNEPMRMMHLSAERAGSVACKSFPIVRKGITRVEQFGQPLFWKLLGHSATVPAWRF